MCPQDRRGTGFGGQLRARACAQLVLALGGEAFGRI
jgi:hypothetical protein